jgi:glutaredoxin-related protein
MKKMNIYVKEEEYHGRAVYRPDCDFSRMLCRILNKKAIPMRVVKILRDCGFDVLGLYGQEK